MGWYILEGRKRKRKRKRKDFLFETTEDVWLRDRCRSWKGQGGRDLDLFTTVRTYTYKQIHYIHE